MRFSHFVAILPALSSVFSSLSAVSIAQQSFIRSYDTRDDRGLVVDLRGALLPDDHAYSAQILNARVRTLGISLPLGGGAKHREVCSGFREGMGCLHNHPRAG